MSKGHYGRTVNRPRAAGRSFIIASHGRFWPLIATFLAVGMATAFAASLQGEELLPPDRPIEEVIDFYVDRELQARGINPAPQAEDTALLRRMTLDLAGRIPTAAEAQAYHTSPDPNKRVAAVERLMASSGYRSHQATEFDVMLMHNQQGSIRNYLLMAFEAGLTWDQIFKDLILANEKPIANELPDEEKRRLQDQNQAAQFMKRRVKDTDILANDVSVLFFGVNVSCAKCHDHPLVDDWKQDHFYGMKSFFNRTFENGDFLGERDYGLVKFKTTAGENRDAKLMFLTGEVLEEPIAEEPNDEQQKKEKELLEKAKSDKVPPPAPSFSRREKLLEVALRPSEHNFFSRSIVNRLMQRLLGEGLVMPVDQMHSGSVVNHPELLDWLARDMETHGYQLSRLVRGIVLSKAYARSSYWPGDERPYAGFYAVANVRPLMPQQLATSLKLASQEPEQFSLDKPADAVEGRLAGVENSSRWMTNLFEVPADDFEVSVTEALLFSNNQRLMNEMVADGGGRLIAKLKELPDPKARIEMATWNIFSRAPREEEIAPLESYLNQRAEHPLEASQQMVWAMMTSSEFRFNH